MGAVGKAIEAAELGIRAVEQSEATKNDIQILLSELYFSYVLALEIERLLRDADKMGQIERGETREKISGFG